MKEIDKKLIETISRYTASGIEQQVDYEKFYLYSLITHIFSVLNGQKHPNPIRLIFCANWLQRSCDALVRNTPQWAATLIPQKVSCVGAT